MGAGGDHTPHGAEVGEGREGREEKWGGEGVEVCQWNDHMVCARVDVLDHGL